MKNAPRPGPNIAVRALSWRSCGRPPVLARIGKLEGGQLAITVEGVDRANSEQRNQISTKLLAHPNHAG